MGWLILWLIFGLVAGSLASGRGRSYGSGFAWGIFLGPLGILIVLLSGPNTQAIEAREMESGERHRCPFCAEVIRAEAVVCRYCGRDLPGAAESPDLDDSDLYAMTQQMTGLSFQDMWHVTWPLLAVGGAIVVVVLLVRWLSSATSCRSAGQRVHYAAAG